MTLYTVGVIVPEIEVEEVDEGVDLTKGYESEAMQGPAVDE